MGRYRLYFELDTDADPSFLLDELEEMVKDNFEDSIISDTTTVERLLDDPS